ncbi:MAG: glycine--tRNA ligase subunit beta [Acidobacteriota bacterium]
MKNKFLFELGLEEVPAGMIEPAAAQLRQSVEALFDENQLTAEAIEVFAAPRRLAFLATGLPDRQAARQEVLLGPPVTVAFKDGKPAPAAHGFAKKMQASLDQLEVVQTEKGDYLALKRTLEGRETPAILADALPGIIGALSWPKNMYWQESRFRFVRPIRWLVALWNKQTVPIRFEGLSAGAMTRGHRFLGHRDVVLKSAGEYLERLRENYVLADAEERQTKISRELERETPKNLKVIADPELLHLVCYLNEYPTVLRGSFDSGFLAIPQEVLITVMRHHQKYFSVADGKGALQPYFLTVLNTSGDPEGRIRKGHEKVLRARLEDAAFFWATDLKTPLGERLPLLDHVLFQEKLGSYRTKTERVRRLCAILKPDKDLETAATLSKCDLTSDMVREFGELQGVMGGLYAREEKYPEAVWRAVYEQYKPTSLDDSSPSTLTGALLALADKVDTVVGCFAAGIVPTGSSDPFALRRHAQGLVKILFDHRLDQYPLPGLVEAARSTLEDQIAVPDPVVADVLGFLTGRVRFIFQEQGAPFDVLNAVLAPGVGGVHQTWLKAEALMKMRGEADFEALAIAFKRVKNILSKQEIVLEAVSEKDLEDPAEADLYRSFKEIEPAVSAAARAGDYLSVLRQIAGLRGNVDRLFDAVLVMTEDARLRNNRLRLLYEISEMFLKIADISEIQERTS